MVEHRPWLTFMTHAVLVLGVLVIAFPIYVHYTATRSEGEGEEKKEEK